MGTFRALLLVVVSVCVFNVLRATPVPDEEKYSDKYDDVDYKSILNSKRLLNNYVKCLLDEGPCTAEGKALRDQLPDILATECKKCTDKQKKGSLDILEILQTEHQDAWTVLAKRWDPEDKLTKPLMEKLKKETGQA
nr:PREDICTED: ejaculatory bulb-specific protein 3-like [Bemisia tabaci]